jgi:hypothetical protein
MSASVSTNGPMWFVANALSQPNAFLVSRIGKIPALLSRPTIGRSSAMISAAARRTLARSDKSQTTDTACWPVCSIAFCTLSSFPLSRPTNTTVPCFATSNAVARPIPEVGPVMMYALRPVGLFA